MELTETLEMKIVVKIDRSTSQCLNPLQQLDNLNLAVEKSVCGSEVLENNIVMKMKH